MIKVSLMICDQIRILKRLALEIRTETALMTIIPVKMVKKLKEIKKVDSKNTN